MTPCGLELADQVCCCGAASHFVLWRLATDPGFVG
jgi:hypothetical protein